MGWSGEKGATGIFASTPLNYRNSWYGVSRSVSVGMPDKNATWEYTIRLDDPSK